MPNSASHRGHETACAGQLSSEGACAYRAWRQREKRAPLPERAVVKEGLGANSTAMRSNHQVWSGQLKKPVTAFESPQAFPLAGSESMMCGVRVEAAWGCGMSPVELSTPEQKVGTSTSEAERGERQDPLSRPRGCHTNYGHLLGEPRKPPKFS